MKIADLYVRVSTDEQAEKGYSLRSQQDVLEKYCELNDIKVRKIYIEDFSAKTFNRPEWKKLILHIRKTKGKCDLLLFTKWDRFSRNTSDAYQTISILKKLEVDAQAIEQPLDLDVPENKMMLAVYLTTPEIENDRRGLNTKAGIRQAKKEGRWTTLAPKGYINKTAENGKKYIAIVEKEANIITWIFNQLAGGKFSGEEILRAARLKGFKCSKNNFYNIIRNPMYCGKIVIPKFKNEDAYLAQALHEPIITETLFFDVQDILDGRKKQYGISIATPNELVLRGFLKCPKCDRALTGSSSKGRTTRTTYYHCTSACKTRFRADKVNSAFSRDLLDYLPKNGYAEIFAQTIADAYQNQMCSVLDERKNFIQQINQQNKKIERARELLLDNCLDATDFRTVKSECNTIIERLEGRLNEINSRNKKSLDIKPIAKIAMENLKNLDVFYKNSSPEGKRYLISCIFTDKLVFDGDRHRTTQVNEIASHIYLINKELEGKKNGSKSSEKTPDHQGWLMGLEPTTLGTTNQYSNQLSYSHRIF
jgi:site-specific DNA recombinase